MAISTYTELKAAVASWINRTTLTAVIPDFIALAEVKTWRKLRLPVQEVVTELTISGTGAVTIPVDFMELKSVVLADANRTEVLRRPVQELTRRQSQTGVPRYFARKDQQWIFGPLPDGSYSVEIYYYKFLDPVSVSNETNYLTVNAPDVLLYGALWQAYLYLKDDEQASRWKGRWIQALQELMDMNEAAEWATTPLQVMETR